MSPIGASKVTIGDRITLLEQLVDGRISLEDAHRRTLHLRGVSYDTSHAIAHSHGYPDRSRLRESIARLRDAAGRTKPAPAPATVLPAVAAGGPSTPTLAAPSIDLPVDQVHPDPNNRDLDDVTELAESIRSTGMLQSIVVRVDDQARHVIVAGHRRYAAAKLLGWATVPVTVRRDLRPDHVLLAMYVENTHRRDLDPIEEARALRLILADLGDGASENALAKKVARTQAHVSGRLRLLELPIDEQERLRAGQMTLTEAVHKSRIASGRVKPKGQDKNWHLSPHHDLADKAGARCRRLGHLRGRTVGGIACGECWESVIRADERQHIHARSAATRQCVICSSTYGSNRTQEPTDA